MVSPNLPHRGVSRPSRERSEAEPRISLRDWRTPIRGSAALRTRLGRVLEGAALEAHASS